MPSFSDVGQEIKNKISVAMERQINEQLFQIGAITNEMYEAAKTSLELVAEGNFDEC